MAVPIAVTRPSTTKQDAAVDRGGDADVADLPRPLRERVALAVGTPEELGEHRAGDVESLRGDVVHLRVLLHPDARELLDPRPEQASRVDERRERDEREQRDLPAEPEHDHERHDELNDVLQDGRRACW